MWVGVNAYLMVYRHVRKIWGGFFYSNHKYGCGILMKIISMNRIIVIFSFRIIDLSAKFD